MNGTEMKSRLAYPQHQTREALMEALVNTPYGEQFSEAAVCEQVLYARPPVLTFTADVAAWRQMIDELAPIWQRLTDTITRTLDAFTDLAGVLAAPSEPLPTNFAEALAAKNRRAAVKASERTRNAIRARPCERY